MTNPGKLAPLLQCKQAPGAKLAVALEPFLAWSHSLLQDDMEPGANINIGDCLFDNPGKNWFIMLGRYLVKPQTLIMAMNYFDR